MKPRCRSSKAYVTNIAVTANRPKAVRVSIWRILYLVSEELAGELTSVVLIGGCLLSLACGAGAPTVKRPNS